MIEEFSFGNFWSFKDIQTLNMSAAKSNSNNDSLDRVNATHVNNELNLVKAKAIYGANASGKSNLVRALAVFVRIIKHCVIEDNLLSLIDSFQLSTETISQPTFFQLIFSVGDTRYRYGFNANNHSLKSEWLFSITNGKEQTLFVREKNDLIEVNQAHFEEGVLYEKLLGNAKNHIFTDTSLFLTHLNSIGFAKKSRHIFNAITSISVISGMKHRGLYDIARDTLTDAAHKKFMVDILKMADIGIGDLDTVEVGIVNLPGIVDRKMNQEFDRSKIIVSSRTQYDSKLRPIGKTEFDFSYQESEGTKKLFELSPFILSSLELGAPLVIDEFDLRFHPLLVRKILALYNSPENRKAQLVFTTHATNLLSPELLKRDQIDFVEKDKYGASHIYSLIEMKGIQEDASFEQNYLHGKYGGIPLLRDFTDLIPFDKA